MTLQERLKLINLQKDWCIEELLPFLYQKKTSKEFMEAMAESFSEQAQNFMALADEIEKILEEVQD